MLSVSNTYCEVMSSTGLPLLLVRLQSVPPWFSTWLLVNSMFCSIRASELLLCACLSSELWQIGLQQHSITAGSTACTNQPRVLQEPLWAWKYSFHIKNATGSVIQAVKFWLVTTGMEDELWRRDPHFHCVNDHIDDSHWWINYMNGFFLRQLQKGT